MRAEPLELLRAIDPGAADKVQGIANALAGETLPFLSDDELAFMETLGLAKKSTHRLLRPGTSIYESQAGYQGRQYLTYTSMLRSTCGGSMAGRFPRTMYPSSTKGRPARVWPYFPGEDEPRDGATPLCSSIDVAWVEEPVWVLFEGSARKLIITAVPTEGQVVQNWQYSVLATIPRMTNADAFIKSYHWDRAAADLDFKAFKTEFIIGLIPFVGGGVQFIDGIQTGTATDIVLGSAGLVGDFTGPLSPFLDLCKSGKMAGFMKKASCLANVTSGSTTVYLVSKNFLNGNGTGLQAGMGALAAAQVLATIVLNVKHRRVDAAKLSEVPSAKALDTDKVRCEAPRTPDLPVPTVRGVPTINPEVVRPELASSVTEVFEAGPNRWVATGKNPEGQMFQRGLTGGIYQKRDAAGEFLALVGGKASDVERDVSLLNSIADSDRVMSEVTEVYSMPMSIRGKNPGIQPGRLSDGSGIIPSGLTVASVTDMGAFMPPAHSSNNYMEWAKNYVSIADKLADNGMKLKPNSRGAAFLRELKEALALERTEFDEIYNSCRILNEDDVNDALSALFERYR